MKKKSASFNMIKAIAPNKQRGGKVTLVAMLKNKIIDLNSQVNTVRNERNSSRIEAQTLWRVIETMCGRE